jgi:hypothetical protein
VGTYQALLITSNGGQQQCTVVGVLWGVLWGRLLWHDDKQLTLALDRAASTSRMHQQ